jgi:hypothetical protein
MTITFENDNDVIVYGLERIIAFAQSREYIFAAQCIWWLASIIRLEQGLIIHIDNLQEWEEVRSGDPAIILREDIQASETEFAFSNIHPSRIHQVPIARAVSATPRDLTEDQRLDLVLDSAEQTIEESKRASNTWQRNRVNPLPQSRAQLKMARKVKRLQEAGKKREAERSLRLREIREQVINNLSKE